MRKLIAFFFAAFSMVAFGQDATLSFQDAQQLPVEIGSHAATRLFDWDADGDLDLVVGGGDGRLWLMRDLGEKELIKAGNRDQWGNSYTGAVLANLLGSDALDLVVAHSDNKISIHEGDGAEFQADGLEFTVQSGCQGRFDVADWDGDGLLDLITGSFGGPLIWYRNEGDKSAPKFGEGESFHEISRAYNSHPRILDFNQDGLLDLALGVNWGSVELFLNRGNADQPDLSKSTVLRWASTGKNLNIRELNGDDTTPDFGDLNGDGVVDLISGGKNGQLFKMLGVGPMSRFAELRATLKSESVDTQLALGILKSLHADLTGNLISKSGRAELSKQLLVLAEEFPDQLRRKQFDLEATPGAPMLAAQYWVILLECCDDREQVAEIAGFGDGHRQLLVDLGVIFVDNNTATPEHLDAMYRLLTAMPKSVWDVQTITAADWLGEGIKTHKITSRSGVNIFAIPMSQKENSFAGDSPRPGVTDVFLICLAHEVAHNMLDTIGRQLRPELYERKFAGLDFAAGPNVIYKSPKASGIDWEATKAKFREIGAWDGDEKTWKDSWKSYFRNLKNAPQFDKAYVRGNVQFFLDAPQEAFATLANQYFADSLLMLEFCKTRWDAGHKSNINQFLLIADYLSENSNDVSFYVMKPGGEISAMPAKLSRDPQNRITGVKFGDIEATFGYDGDGVLATSFEM